MRQNAGDKRCWVQMNMVQITVDIVNQNESDQWCKYRRYG